MHRRSRVDPAAAIVQPGRNSSREATVDAADYFHAFYWAAERAQRSILLSGWEFDTACVTRDAPGSRSSSSSTSAARR